MAPKWCCDSRPAADPERGASAAGGVGGGSAVTPQRPKTGRVKKMVRLAVELLLLLGLLLLTLHITVLRSSPSHQGNLTLSQDQQYTVIAEVSAVYFFYSTRNLQCSINCRESFKLLISGVRAQYKKKWGISL